ncbi:uncharacterized protein LOC144694284 [Cetorhinus maximus]
METTRPPPRGQQRLGNREEDRGVWRSGSRCLRDRLFLSLLISRCCQMFAAGLPPVPGPPPHVEFENFGCSLKEAPEIPQLLKGRVLFKDFAEMQLPNFPAAIFQLQHLEELHLEKNHIEEIPPQINCLQKLRVLYLNSNKLLSICEELGDLQQLQSLDLSKNPLHLSLFTNTVCRLRALRELRLYNMNLKQFPGQICKKLHHLQLLGLSGNNLDSLPWEISNLTELQQLYLQSNNLQVLPFGFCQLHRLEILDLRQNALIYLPDDINCLQNLKHLYLSDNHLAFIPQALGSCSSLCVLDISRNCLDLNLLQSLPDSLAELDLSDNQLHTFPTVVCQLRGALQLLYLRNTQLKSLSCCFSDLTGIRFLDLSQNVLRYFPKQICSLSQLEVLSLDDSKLKEVLPGIKNLTKLKILGLTGNRFRAFPQEICSVESLEKLYLGQDHGMKFTHIPEEISQLVNLKELYLENNEIQFLPSTIGLLQSLTVLDCHENRLLELPESITDIHVFGASEAGVLTPGGVRAHALQMEESIAVMSSTLSWELKHMSSDHERFANLTERHLQQHSEWMQEQCLIRERCLQKLLASCNRITHLPANFDQLKKLEILSLERNPLEKPLDEICHQGVSAVLQYLQTKKAQHFNATKIQAWWRGLMVRKELGPFKNLFPKKDKKQKKDKGKSEKGKQQKGKKKK